MISKSKLDNFQNNAFNVSIFLTYLLYFLIFFRLSDSAPKYLGILDKVFKTYIALFLVIRFNPLRKVQFTDLDRKVSFSAGLFILTTFVLNLVRETFFMENTLL
jgi:hypothetical protein